MEPLFLMPPPKESSAVFTAMVLSVMVTAPRFRTPPPMSSAKLLLTVLLIRASVPVVEL